MWNLVFTALLATASNCDSHGIVFSAGFWSAKLNGTYLNESRLEARLPRVWSYNSSPLENLFVTVERPSNELELNVELKEKGKLIGGTSYLLKSAKIDLGMFSKIIQMPLEDDRRLSLIVLMNKKELCRFDMRLNAPD